MCYPEDMLREVMVALAAVVFASAASAADAAPPKSPEDVLRAYLRAVKAEDYGAAYEHISTAMRGGKDKDAWVAETKAFMSFADVKIFEFKVHDGKIEGDKARVPNRLESQDRFVNALGLTEYELYTLVKEGGAWKVDSQLLLEPAEVSTWFPDAAK
jgi:hypothetical protein